MDASAAGHAETLRVLALLDDPVRRGLYSAVRSAAEPLTREDAAEAVGISRKLAAFHLDRLVASGLLVVAEPHGTRRMGRPPKRYAPGRTRLYISIPDRRTEDLASVLIDAIASAEPGETARDAALRAGEESGRRLGAAVRTERKPGRLGAERALTLAQEVLATRGYEPTRPSTSCVRLLNCPFLPLAEQDSDLVCGINQRFVAGLAQGLGAERIVDAVLVPAQGRCCVELRASSSA